MSTLWDELTVRLRATLSLDTEWTIESGQTLDWWGWLFPTRIELREGPAPSGESFVTGTIRTSTRIGRVRPDGAERVSGFLADWNQDAPGAIGLLDYDGTLNVVWGAPILPGREGLAFSLTIGVAARQSAYAVDLARILTEHDLIDLEDQPHPEFGRRSNPDELVQIYIDSCSDPFTTDAYNQPEVMTALRELMTSEGFDLGFTSQEHGITTFQLGDGYTHVGLQFDWPSPDAFVQAGPMLRIRAGAGEALAFPPGHTSEAIDAATRANRRVWSQSLTNMLGAWSGAPDQTGTAFLTLSGMVPASALIFDPRFTPSSYAHVLRDLLFCVLHQAIETAEMTHDG